MTRNHVGGRPGRRRISDTLASPTTEPNPVSLFCNPHLVALDDVELDFFAVADGSQILLRVVLHDGRLMDKNVLFGVIPERKTDRMVSF